MILLLNQVFLILIPFQKLEVVLAAVADGLMDAENACMGAAALPPATLPVLVELTVFPLADDFKVAEEGNR